MRGWRTPASIWQHLAGLSLVPRETFGRVVHVSGACPRTPLVHQACSSVSTAMLRTYLAPALWISAHSWCSLLVRFKSTKGSKTAGKKGKQGVDEAEEEEEDVPEASDYEDELPDDPGLPKDYKDQEKSVQSFRYDVVIKAGLDMARNKIEDAFYDSRLRLNGQRLIKKSKTVRVGDALDLVLEEDSEMDTVTLMRVVLKKVTKSEAAKHKVILRRWKRLQLPKQDVYKL